MRKHKPNQGNKTKIHHTRLGETSTQKVFFEP